MNVLLLLAAAELQEARDKDASRRGPCEVRAEGGCLEGRPGSRGDSTEVERDLNGGELSGDKASVNGGGDSSMKQAKSRPSSLKREASSPLRRDAARPAKRATPSPLEREASPGSAREAPTGSALEAPTGSAREASTGAAREASTGAVREAASPPSTGLDGGGSEGSGDSLTEEDEEEAEEDEGKDEEGEEGSVGATGAAGGRAGAGGKEMRRWTAEQDDALRAAVALHRGQNWKAIAQMVEGRDHVQCLQRWKKVLQPGLVKGMWSHEEDELLLKLMSTSQPKNWAGVAAMVPGRTAKQCRERWSLSLDPSINRGPWTQEEDELLVKLHDTLGNCWAQIKGHLSSRTENAVKTRYKTLERARFKDAAVAWTPELEAQLRDLAVRFDCRIDEVTKHLPRSLRGISSHAMRQRCPLLREAEEKNLLF